MDTLLVRWPERTISPNGPMTAPAPRRVLVIHPGALGDVLQAVPALRALAALDGRRAREPRRPAAPRGAARRRGRGGRGALLRFPGPRGRSSRTRRCPPRSPIASPATTPSCPGSGRARRRIRIGCARWRPAPSSRRRCPRAARPTARRCGATLASSLAPLGVEPGAADGPRSWRRSPFPRVAERGRASAHRRRRGRGASGPPRASGRGRRVESAGPPSASPRPSRPPRGRACAVLHEGPADREAVAALAARLAALGRRRRPCAPRRARPAAARGRPRRSPRLSGGRLRRQPSGRRRRRRRRHRLPAGHARALGPWGPRALAIAPATMRAAAALRSALTGTPGGCAAPI